MNHNPGSARSHPIGLIASRRTLYVVDVENMAGSGDLCTRDVEAVQYRLFAAVPSSVQDQTVVAVSHHNGEAALFGWSGSAERKFRSGRDGADLALLETIDDIAWTAARFDRVVIASGDHAFALTTRALKIAGMEVLIVSPDVGMSPALRKAADGHVVRLGPSRSLSQSGLINFPKDAA